MSYLFRYDPFYRGNFKFKAKLGLGAVLLTLSYHSDSKMGHVINYLLTGCSCRTRKYKPLIFQTALASSGCMKNLGLVFPGTALADLTDLLLYCIVVLLIDIFYLGETLFFDRRYGNVNFLNDKMLKDMMKCCFVKHWSYM